MTSIGDNAFKDCLRLNTLTVGAKTPPTVNDLGLEMKQYLTVQLNVPQGSKEMYLFAEGWRKFLNVAEGDVSGISNPTIDAEDESQPIYNLQGVKMTENKENLPAGIYIQGGKKFMVR